MGTLYPLDRDDVDYGGKTKETRPFVLSLAFISSQGNYELLKPTVYQ